MFDTYKLIPKDQRRVVVANRYKMPVFSIGTVRLRLRLPNNESNGLILVKNVILHGVLHAPESTESLISIMCLTERGLKVTFNEVGAILGNNGSGVKGNLPDTTYEITTRAFPNYCVYKKTRLDLACQIKGSSSISLC